MSDTALLALNHNWLDASSGNLNAADNQAMNCQMQALGQNYQGCLTGGDGLSVYYYHSYYPYYPWAYPVTIASPARPIKLSLSEVERLRKVAKADEKVKAILAKFTDLIEITVDFE
jgi:hypothetical protein